MSFNQKLYAGSMCCTLLYGFYGYINLTLGWVTIFAFVHFAKTTTAKFFTDANVSPVHFPIISLVQISL